MEINMQYAIIQNDVVINIALSNAPLNENWIASDTASIGWNYKNGVFSAPIDQTPVIISNPTEWLIDIGPFFDRFGAAKMSVLTSTDVGVRAILTDIQVRHWIDLKRSDVISGVTYVGSKVPMVTIELQTAILTTPVTAEENLVLRKLYFI